MTVGIPSSVYELSGDKIESQPFAMQADVLAPTQLAARRDIAIISDDGALRSLAVRLGVESSVWLEEEGKSLASMLQLKHNHVSVTTRALSVSLEQRL